MQSGGVGSIAPPSWHIGPGFEVYGTASPTNHEWLDTNGVRTPQSITITPLQDQVETTCDILLSFMTFRLHRLNLLN